MQGGKIAEMAYYTPVPTGTSASSTVSRDPKKVRSVLSPLTEWADGVTWGTTKQRSFSRISAGGRLSSSSMSRNVHSLMLCIQHFLCRLQCRPPPKKCPVGRFCRRCRDATLTLKLVSYHEIEPSKLKSCWLEKILAHVAVWPFSEPSRNITDVEMNCVRIAVFVCLLIATGKFSMHLLLLLLLLLFWLMLFMLFCCCYCCCFLYLFPC